jgi:hypothetical protein
MCAGMRGDSGGKPKAGAYPTINRVRDARKPGRREGGSPPFPINRAPHL